MHFYFSKVELIIVIEFKAIVLPFMLIYLQIPTHSYY